MNIGLFADCWRPTTSGVVTSIVQLRASLERRGHKVVVVTVNHSCRTGGSGTVYRFPSIPFHKASGFRLGLVTPRVVAPILERERIDVVHTHTEFSLGWAAKAAARARRLPLVHTGHTLYTAYRHYLPLGKLLPDGMIRRYLGLFLGHYDALVCPSTKAARYYAAAVPGIEPVIIGNGIAGQRFCPGPLAEEEEAEIRRGFGLKTSDRVLLYVGRLGPEKRTTELLHALASLLLAQPACKALLVGNGPDHASLSGVARDLGIEEQVVLTGVIPWTQIYKLYLLADLFVTASLSEMQPMTLIEAAICGLPVVARRDEGYEDLVRDRYNGYLIDSDRQFAPRVSELLGDRAKLRALGENGRLLADRFSAESHAEALESLYRPLADSRPT